MKFPKVWTGLFIKSEVPEVVTSFFRSWFTVRLVKQVINGQLAIPHRWLFDPGCKKAILVFFYLFIYLFIYLVTHKTLYNMNKSC